MMKNLHNEGVVNEVKSALAFLAKEDKKEFFPKFFKCGPGEYAEGDEFIGVTVPDQRKIVKAFEKHFTLDALSDLLSSKIHEHRHCAILILVSKFEKEKSENQRKIMVDFYLSHLPYINNWDLVDNSSYKIVGRYCYDRQEESVLMKLSQSENLWHQRIAIVATLWHVKNDEFTLTEKLVKENLHHAHDLMHKANGWLLREIGKKNENRLLSFLNQHYHTMPRTTLRYAIEKLDENLRQEYLKGKI